MNATASLDMNTVNWNMYYRLCWNSGNVLHPRSSLSRFCLSLGAVVQVQLGSYDLAIPDLIMPKPDGWDVLLFIRQAPRSAPAHRPAG